MRLKPQLLPLMPLLVLVLVLVLVIVAVGKVLKLEVAWSCLARVMLVTFVTHWWMGTWGTGYPIC